MHTEIIFAVLASSGFWAVVMKLIDVWISRKSGMQAMLERIQSSIDAERDAREQKDAEDARNRILRFADECRRGERHSEEFFIQVREDITFYESYCGAHPDFRNQRTVASEAIINRAYDHCVENQDFL